MGMSDQQPMFYLQDSRSYVGNDMQFWAEQGKGYTTDLRKAWKLPQPQAVRMHESRETDIPWPVEYIDARQRPAVDVQCCNRNEALRDTGIKLVKPQRPRKYVSHCVNCGGFLSERQQYIGCPKCGGDNRP